MRPIGSKRQRCGSWEVRVTRGGVTLSGTVADEGAADALMLSFAHAWAATHLDARLRAFEFFSGK